MASPIIHPTAFVHPAAHVIGSVTMGARASVWPTAVLRGDSAPIVVGEQSNVQDGSVLHVDPGIPCTIGSRVAIGHRAIVHGATVEDDCLVGMGAILLNRVRVGRGSIIGAGAVCPEGMDVPPNSLVLGVPGRVIRETTAEERERIARTVASYVALQREHAESRHAAVGAGEMAMLFGGAPARGLVGPMDARNDAMSPWTQAPQVEESRIASMMRVTKREGQWVMPRLLRIAAVMGQVELDFTNALILPGVSEIALWTWMSQLEITVPSSVRIDEGNISVKRKKRMSPDDPVPRAVIRLTGEANASQVEIARPKL